MSPISRSGPRRWIATLLLLVMALATAARAEGHACARASEHPRAELAPDADPGVETTMPGTPLETDTAPVYTSCGSTALLAAAGAELAEPPLRDEEPPRFTTRQPPGPEPVPQYRPPRQG